MKFARTLLILIASAMLTQGEPYEPKPGSPERKAVMDAMRAPISKHAGKPVEFTGNLKISGDWAKFTGDVATKDGKPPLTEEARYDFSLDFFAILKKEKGTWKVLYWDFGGDTGAMDEAKKRFPKAPKDLIPDDPK